MRKDLTGNRYGKLTVLRVDEERTGSGKVYWLCQCDCGKIASVQSTSLTRRKCGTKSCGCARNSSDAVKKAKETRNKYPKDISGLKFGRLTVLEKQILKVINHPTMGHTYGSVNVIAKIRPFVIIQDML